MSLVLLMPSAAQFLSNLCPEDFYAVLRGRKFLTLGNLECDVSRDGQKCAGKHIIPLWCKMYVLGSILVCKLTYWCL